MSDLRFGTISFATVPYRLTDDLDLTTELPVDVWVPPVVPAVADRVLYEIVHGQVVVLHDITSPTRIWGTTLSMGGTANTADSQAISFPAGFFPAAPRVLGTVGSATSNPSTTNTEIYATGITTAGFTANFIRSNTSVCTVRWLAILS